MPVIGPSWAGTATELEHYTPPRRAVAVPHRDDGEGLNLQDRLKCAFYEATHWPTTASWSLPAAAPEPQLLQ
jgi:hypothetical protein